MDDFRIRRYEPADCAGLVALFQRSVHQLARNDYRPEQLAAWAPADPDLEAWRARLTAGETWIGVRNGELAGFATLTATGRLDLFYVDPRHARAGVGRRLLDYVIRMARVQGWQNLSTDASLTARPFFAANGFTIESTQTVQRRGVTMGNYRMSRPLR